MWFWPILVSAHECMVAATFLPSFLATQSIVSCDALSLMLSHSCALTHALILCLLPLLKLLFKFIQRWRKNATMVLPPHLCMYFKHAMCKGIPVSVSVLSCNLVPISSSSPHSCICQFSVTPYLFVNNLHRPPLSCVNAFNLYCSPRLCIHSFPV